MLLFCYVLEARLNIEFCVDVSTQNYTELRGSRRRSKTNHSSNPTEPRVPCKALDELETIRSLLGSVEVVLASKTAGQ